MTTLAAAAVPVAMGAEETTAIFLPVAAVSIEDRGSSPSSNRNRCQYRTKANIEESRGENAGVSRRGTQDMEHLSDTLSFIPDHRRRTGSIPAELDSRLCW